MKKNCFINLQRATCALFMYSLIRCAQSPPNNLPTSNPLPEATDTSTSSGKTPDSNPTFHPGTLQFTDKNGLKQGLWKEHRNGKLWKEEHYLNNKLHGICNEYLADGTICQTQYKNGLKDGFYQMFTHGSATGLYVSLYQNDKFQWAAFPYELAQYIVPVKGMQTQADSINIKVYYLSGKILYEGKFYGEKNGAAKGCGLHKSYYENGEIRTVLDYNQDSITAYDNKGNMQHLKGIRKYRGEILQ